MEGRIVAGIVNNAYIQPKPVFLNHTVNAAVAALPHRFPGVFN
jgi:hypothetical protein